MSNPWMEPVEMAGQHARLLPLSPEHTAALCEAVKDGELWKLWYTAVPSPEGMKAEIERRLKLQAQPMCERCHPVPAGRTSECACQSRKQHA